MPWVTINGNHVLIGEDDGGGPSKAERVEATVEKAKKATKLVTCRICERKVVPRGRDVCDRPECRMLFAAGIRQWRRLYGMKKQDVADVLEVKKYRGNPRHPK